MERSKIWWILGCICSSMPLVELTNSQLCWDVPSATTNWTELTVLSHWINVLALAFTWSWGLRTSQIQSSMTFSEGGSCIQNSTIECSFQGTVAHLLCISLITQAVTASPPSQSQLQLYKLRMEVGFASKGSPLMSSCWSPWDMMNLKLNIKLCKPEVQYSSDSWFYSHTVALQVLRFTEISQEESCNCIQNAVAFTMRSPTWEVWQAQEGPVMAKSFLFFPRRFKRSGGKCSIF